MNKKLYIIWSILVILLIFLVVYLFAVNKKLDNIYDNMKVNKKTEVIDSKEDVNSEVLGDDEVNSNKKIDTKVIEENIDNKLENKVKEESTNKDELVINNLNETLNNIDNMDKLSIKEKAKEIFISIVDFLLYDGEINGVTFDELSKKGKENALKVIRKIDEKLDSLAPGYKETITSNGKYLFNKLSGLLKSGKSEIKDYFEKEDLIKLKEEVKEYSEVLKNNGSKILTNTKDKLNEVIKNFKK